MDGFNNSENIIEYVSAPSGLSANSDVINLPRLIWSEKDLGETQALYSSWGLSSSVSTLLKVYGLNSIDVLDKMEIEDVDKFFCNIDSSGYFGNRIKFQSGLKQWRKYRNKPLLCGQGTLSPPSTRKVLALLEKISNNLNSAAASSTISHVSETNATETNLTDLLKYTVRGQLLLAFYQKKGQLDSKRQKDLTHCIVERFIGKGTKMSYRDMNQWARAIAETFPTENKETYFLARKQGKKNPTGKLFSRWCNVAHSTDNENAIAELEEEIEPQELMSDGKSNVY